MKSIQRSLQSKELLLGALFFCVLACFVLTLLLAIVLSLQPRMLSSSSSSSSSSTITSDATSNNHPDETSSKASDADSTSNLDETFDEEEGSNDESNDDILYPSTASSSSSPQSHSSFVDAENQVSMEPSAAPSQRPVREPSVVPSAIPSTYPTQRSLRPTWSPSNNPTRIIYVPGQFPANASTVLGLSLSIGLNARLVAISGQAVLYHSRGFRSALPFHALPDFGATFKDPRPINPGGWIYVSNSEVREPKNAGGVGALTFDRHGQVIDYRMLLIGTTANCGGGRTPWDTWISCEEHPNGKLWQVDPTGARPAQQVTMGSDGGKFESFAYDDRHGHYFVTEDDAFGPLRRFIPSAASENASGANTSNDPWEVLHGNGETTFLTLTPNTTTSSGQSHGTFQWIHDIEVARSNAHAMYPNAEGIDVQGDELYFISKVRRLLFILDLDRGTYTSHSTRQGVFDGQPDQIQRILDYTTGEAVRPDASKLLYFTEDGGRYAGVHARNRDGQFLTILESPVYRNDETTGLAFSPDAMHMYVAYQRHGILFDIRRDDGMPFTAQTLNVKYPATTVSP